MIHLNEAEWEQAEAEPTDTPEPIWPEIALLVLTYAFAFALGFSASGQLFGWGK